MMARDDVVQWKEERMEWQRILEMLKSGTMTSGEQLSGAARIDTTADCIVDCERHIAELDILCPRKNPKIQESCKNKAIHRTSARANSKTQGGTRIDSDSICHRHHSVFSGFLTV